MRARKLLLLSLVLVFSFGVLAQEKEDAVKEKQERELKLIEQILSDAGNLRLPENRAYVYARVGSALWQRNEKIARGLFQEALADLITAQTEAQNEKVSNRQYFQSLIYGQTPRQDIINLVAARDPELALEYFERSRPAIIADAMQNLKYDETSTLQQFARNELAVEQRLLGLASEQNPQLLIKRLRESMKKSASYDTINLLKKIALKDPQSANALAAELVESFLNLDFSKYSQTAEAAGYLLAELGKVPATDEKPLKVSDELLRRLASKMLDDWLSPKTEQIYSYWNCSPVIDRLFPERAAQIKKKVETNNRRNQTEEAQRYSKLVASSETPPEAMIAQADKFQSVYRNEIYRAAASKYAAAGNYAEAEKLIQTSIADGQSEYYLTQFYINTAYQLAGQNKFDEANNYVNRIENEYQRINALLNLANTAYGQNPKENKKLAEGFLNQARGLLTDPPETQNDVTAAISLAAAYMEYDANESFRLIETLLPNLNEIIQAQLVLMKFQSGGGMRQGEVQIAGNYSGLFGLEGTLRLLREKDFDRTLQFANGFTRPETRLWLRMQLINENTLPVNTGIITRRSMFLNR